MLPDCLRCYVPQRSIDGRKPTSGIAATWLGVRKRGSIVKVPGGSDINQNPGEGFSLLAKLLGRADQRVTLTPQIVS